MPSGYLTRKTDNDLSSNGAHRDVRRLPPRSPLHLRRRFRAQGVGHRGYRWLSYSISPDWRDLPRPRANVLHRAGGCPLGFSARRCVWSRAERSRCSRVSGSSSSWLDGSALPSSLGRRGGGDRGRLRLGVVGRAMTAPTFTCLRPIVMDASEIETAAEFIAHEARSISPIRRPGGTAAGRGARRPP